MVNASPASASTSTRPCASIPAAPASLALIDASASAVPLILWCSHEQMAAATQDDPLPKSGHPRVAAAIAFVAVLILVSLVGFGGWAWYHAGISLNSVHSFVAFGALGVGVGAMLGLIAVGVAQPSLLSRNMADLLLNESALRHSGIVEVNATKVHQIMRRLQKLGQSSGTAIGLAPGAVSCMVAGLVMAWLQWPGTSAILAAPALAGFPVASLIIGIIFASLLGLAAMIAGGANEIRLRMAIALARLRDAQNHLNLPCAIG